MDRACRDLSCHSMSLPKRDGLRRQRVLLGRLHEVGVDHLRVDEFGLAVYELDQLLIKLVGLRAVRVLLGELRVLEQDHHDAVVRRTAASQHVLALEARRLRRLVGLPAAAQLLQSRPAVRLDLAANYLAEHAPPPRHCGCHSAHTITMLASPAPVKPNNTPRRRVLKECGLARGPCYNRDNSYNELGRIWRVGRSPSQR